MAETSKETAAKIQDLLTVCLAKAYGKALSSTDGPYWFNFFKQEELRPDQRFPIVRENQRSVTELDFQALMKILYYRKNYSERILGYYGKSDLISSNPKNRTPFQKTLGRLINDYRNEIAAHVSADKIEENIKGTNSRAGYDYENAILDMCSVAQVFKSIQDDKGVSYYDQILRIAQGTKKPSILPIAAAVGGVLIIALILLLILRPWDVQEMPEQETNILEITDNEIGDDNSNLIAREFFFKAKDTAVAGIYDDFKKLFENGYSEEDISYVYDRLREGDYSKDMDIIRSFVYTDNEILAYQWIGNDQPASRWFIKRINGEWKFGLTATHDLFDKRQDKTAGRLRDYFGLSPKTLWVSEEYDILFEIPMEKDLYMKVYAVTDEAIACFIFNGTDQTIRTIDIDDTIVSVLNMDDWSNETVYLDKSSDHYSLNCEIGPGCIEPVIISINEDDQVPEIPDPDNVYFRISTKMEWSDTVTGVE